MAKEGVCRRLGRDWLEVGGGEVAAAPTLGRLCRRNSVQGAGCISDLPVQRMAGAEPTAPGSAAAAAMLPPLPDDSPLPPAAPAGLLLRPSAVKLPAASSSMARSVGAFGLLLVLTNCEAAAHKAQREDRQATPGRGWLVVVAGSHKGSTLCW